MCEFVVPFLLECAPWHFTMRLQCRYLGMGYLRGPIASHLGVLPTRGEDEDGPEVAAIHRTDYYVLQAPSAYQVSSVM